MRLIDADLLKGHIASYCGMFTDEGFLVRLEAVLGGIDFQPTVDAVEVVHAKWLRTDDTYTVFECSNCKRTDNYKRNYCANCGAKMDGKVE